MTSEELLARLRQALRYDPEDGKFYWIEAGYRNRHPVGTVAGTLKDGYQQINYDGRIYRGARIAWLFMTGDFPPKGQEVDHINTNRADDRWSNLRLVTRSRNNLNPSALRSDNTVGVRGVHRQPNGTWFARIAIDKQIIHLGTFKTVAEANAARLAAEEHYGLRIG